MTDGGKASIWKVEIALPALGERVDIEFQTWWVLTTNAERAMGGVRGALENEPHFEWLSIERLSRHGTIVIDPDVLEEGGYVLRDDDEEDPFE